MLKKKGKKGDKPSVVLHKTLLLLALQHRRTRAYPNEEGVEEAKGNHPPREAFESKESGSDHEAERSKRYRRY